MYPRAPLSCLYLRAHVCMFVWYVSHKIVDSHQREAPRGSSSHQAALLAEVGGPRRLSAFCVTLLSLLQSHAQQDSFFLGCACSNTRGTLLSMPTKCNDRRKQATVNSIVNMGLRFKKHHSIIMWKTPSSIYLLIYVRIFLLINSLTWTSL